MRSHILVPLDGSALAEGVLPQVLPIARATGAALLLTQVIPIVRGVEPLAGLTVPAEAITERLEADEDVAADYLAAVAARLEPAGCPVHTCVLVGDPATTLVEYAGDHPAIMLIAMVTHGRTGLRRWVLGSVAEAVLHATPVPLLLARFPFGPPAQAPECVYRTILVPVDGSPFAELALAEAQVLAGATGALLVLTTAVDELADSPAPHLDMPNPINARRQAEAAQMATYLETLAQRLKATGLKVDTRLTFGHPAEAILHASEAADADLILMATHGRTGFQRLRLGSVALKVVQSATRPVYLVHAGLADKKGAERHEQRAT